MQSKALIRSVATSSKCSPRSKISRTLPLAILRMPGRSRVKIPIARRMNRPATTANPLFQRGELSQGRGQRFHRQADHIGERALDTLDQFAAVFLRGVGSGFVEGADAGQEAAQLRVGEPAQMHTRDADESAFAPRSFATSPYPPVHVAPAPAHPLHPRKTYLPL